LIEDIRALARELLEKSTVECVIGYEVGPTGRVRPAFVYEPAGVERLIFDARCYHNLVTYLTRRNKPRKKGEEVPTTAVLVKPCDARSLQVLLNENQVQRDKVYIIGVACPGMQNADGTPELRCTRCDQRVPLIYDVLCGEPPEVPAVTDTYDDVERIEALPLEERLAYWLGELDRCIRCYACRQACPTCFCSVCEAERDDSLWVGIADRIPEKAFFHIIRAFHQAGRCAECNACEAVCPMGIPLSLINRKVAKDVAQMMAGYRAGESDEPTPLVTMLTGEEAIDEIH